jgi:Bifunctional DNA primase/polymerase, N-terminal
VIESQSDYPLMLVDRNRLELFAMIGQSRRCFEAAEFRRDADGVPWLVIEGEAIAVGFTSLGPGWVFDEQLRGERSYEYATRSSFTQEGDDELHRERLDARLQEFRFGAHAERLLWWIHRAVLVRRCSIVTVASTWLARMLWGKDQSRWPAAWRITIVRALASLTWLHVADKKVGVLPQFGSSSVLFTNVKDLRGVPEDDYIIDFGERSGQRQGNFQIEIGQGFLGLLELLAVSGADPPVRLYDFDSARRSGSPSPKFRRLAKTGRLVSVFLPAQVSHAPLRSWNADRRRILQTIVRETTRGGRHDESRDPQGAVRQGNRIPGYAPGRLMTCEALLPGGAYVGFNGNGKLSGRGYRIATWAARCGFRDDVASFLAELEPVARCLNLVTVGIASGSRESSLRALRRLSRSGPGRRTLETTHLRVYSEHGYLTRWTEVFGGLEPLTLGPMGATVSGALVLNELATLNLSQRALALALNIDPSFLSKLVNGKKPWPNDLLAKAETWIKAQRSGPGGLTEAKVDSKGQQNVLEEALALLKQGWSVIPQHAGQKKPAVRWAAFQEHRPSAQNLRNWLETWPDAGLAVVLGPVSDLLVIDVDGDEAYAALIERLGSEPLAPKSLSGSRASNRFHLFFKHPPLKTRAKQTPWHSKLEFRGKGGVVVIPPSLHKSGYRYAWAQGRSPADIALPDAPQAVLDALSPAPVVRREGIAPGARRPGAWDDLDASPSTRAFLSGQYQNGPGWNSRLFQAACDLRGRGMPLERAQPLLLKGAAPWTAGEHDAAIATIASAYSCDRDPGRV